MTWIEACCWLPRAPQKTTSSSVVLVQDVVDCCFFAPGKRFMIHALIIYIYIYLVISAGVMIFYPGTGNKNQRQGRNPKVNNKSAKLYHANSWCRNPGSLCNEQNYQQKVIIHFSQIHKNHAPFNLLVKGLKHL